MRAVALLADVIVVVVFAAIGRRSHAEGDALSGVVVTAWPFLAGLALGWAGTIALRRRVPWTWRDGLPVWLLTVTGGMVLRHLTGKGTAFSFILVATVFLGLFLLGWRALVARLAPRTIPQS